VRIYIFSYRESIILTKNLCERIMRYIKKGQSLFEDTLDLGLSKANILLKNNYLHYKDHIIPVDIIRNIARKSNENTVYSYNDGIVKVLQFFDKGNFYKLKYIGDTAPTLEINGIHMHRIKGITPWEDSAIKVKLLNIRRYDRVLDLCTGLGYTAIQAFRRHPLKIITVEKDINVLRIAEYNPWSRDLANIPIILSDIRESLEEIRKGYFNKIIYDPPSFRIAEELYSLDIYKLIYSILPNKGLLFHYVGYVGSLSHKSIVNKIKSRCKQAGFKIIREINYGVLLAK